MTNNTYNTQQNLVKDLRKIRDQISNEIKDMSFEEERNYLDKLINNKEQFLDKKDMPGDEIKIEQH